MTRIQQDLPLTVESYDSLDSANKKRNMFMRTAEKLEKSVKALTLAEKAINEANLKIETANKQCFQGNEELRELKEKMQKEIVDHSYTIGQSAQRLAELDSIKSKWYFKLFGRWSM